MSGDHQKSSVGGTGKASVPLMFNSEVTEYTGRTLGWYEVYFVKFTKHLNSSTLQPSPRDLPSRELPRETMCHVRGSRHMALLFCHSLDSNKSKHWAPSAQCWAQFSPSLLQGNGRGEESSWWILLWSPPNLVPEQNLGDYSGDRLFCWWGGWAGCYTKLRDLVSLELWWMSFLSSALAGVDS